MRPRQVKSLCGPAAYEREVFECQKCRHSFAPADAVLGVAPGQKMTRSLVRRVAWAAASGSFTGAEADLRELGGLCVSGTECARVAQDEGGRIGRAQRRREREFLAPVIDIGQAVPVPEIACQRLVIEADATTVLTVPDEEHKSVWCAKAFGLEHRAHEGSGRPVITESRRAASALDLEDFGPRIKALALRTGLRKAKARAFLADGAPSLWLWAEHHLPPGTVFIQDLWHVLEHLAQLAKDLFGQAWRPPFERWKALMRTSHVAEVIAELEHEHTRRRKGPRERLFEEIRYLRNGQSRMDYARYEKEGWPLGSGAIEGECKHLVKERFGLTGAHWRRTNIPLVLALRLSIFNGEWEREWQEDQTLLAA